MPCVVIIHTGMLNRAGTMLSAPPTSLENYESNNLPFFLSLAGCQYFGIREKTWTNIPVDLVVSGSFNFGPGDFLSSVKQDPQNAASLPELLFSFTFPKLILYLDFDNLLCFAEPLPAKCCCENYMGKVMGQPEKALYEIPIPLLPQHL